MPLGWPTWMCIQIWPRLHISLSFTHILISSCPHRTDIPILILGHNLTSQRGISETRSTFTTITPGNTGFSVTMFRVISSKAHLKAYATFCSSEILQKRYHGGECKSNEHHKAFNTADSRSCICSWNAGASLVCCALICFCFTVFTHNHQQNERKHSLNNYWHQGFINATFPFIKTLNHDRRI